MSYIGLGFSDACVARVKPTVRASEDDLRCLAELFYKAFQNNGNTRKENEIIVLLHPQDRAFVYDAFVKRGLRAAILDRLRRDFPVPPSLSSLVSSATRIGQRIAVTGSAPLPGSPVLMRPAGTPASGPMALPGGGGVPMIDFRTGGGGGGGGAVDLQSIVTRAYEPARKLTIAPGSEGGGGFLGMSTMMLVALGGVAAVGTWLVLRRKKSAAKK